MKRIFKYPLEVEDHQILEIPSNRLLSVQEQNGEVVVYAMVDTVKPPIKYEFAINGTGNPVNFDADNFNFLGTVKLYNGSIMFHVFYRELKEETLDILH